MIRELEALSIIGMFMTLLTGLLWLLGVPRHTPVPTAYRSIEGVMTMFRTLDSH